MNKDKKIENIFDGLRKLAFFVGHGKYNDYMSLEEVKAIKSTLEKILDLEKEYAQASTKEQKERMYTRLSPFESFSIKDFMHYDIKTL